MGVTGSTVTNFDAWAGQYDHSPLQPSLYLPVHQSTLRLAGRLVPHPRRILDVGCGTARLLRQARRQYPGAELVGVDPAWQMVAIARSGTSPGLQIGYVQGAVERLPFVCEGFDLVVATLSFRHWTDPKAGIGQLARVLAPGGLLVLADVFSSCRHRVGGIRLRWRRRLPVPAQLAPALVAYELTSNRPRPYSLVRVARRPGHRGPEASMAGSRDGAARRGEARGDPRDHDPHLAHIGQVEEWSIRSNQLRRARRYRSRPDSHRYRRP